MRTLIELWDQRPLENVLGPEVFEPERVVYICPCLSGEEKAQRTYLREFFRRRGLQVDVQFRQASPFRAEELLEQLRQTVEQEPDCCLDITGGTDAALFAAGLLCAEKPVPVFTYSRRKNSFFPIYGSAPVAAEPCQVQYAIEDFIRMAGGAMRSGRVENQILNGYLDEIEPFFRLYMKYRRGWTKIVSYMQRVSQVPKDAPISLSVRGNYRVKGDRGNWVSAPEEALRDMEQMGWICDLHIRPEAGVDFRFRDKQVRAWLRDVGSVLELYVYKACLDTGLFHEVRTSVIADWESVRRENAVSNEIDVMAARGVVPLFISCKTCDVRTEALNELAILRDRFGSGVSRAAIVTAERGGAAMRNRAHELDIEVIDLQDLQNGSAAERIQALMVRE